VGCEDTVVSVTETAILQSAATADGEIQNAIDDQVVGTFLGVNRWMQLELAGDGVGDDWGVYCDERLKTDIEDIKSGDKIALLKPKKFVMKGKNKAGFVAQDVETVFPDSVKSNEDGIKAMFYGEIIAHLVKKVQELTVEVESLKAG